MQYPLKMKAFDSFSLAPMETAPQNYPKKCVNSKSPKNELDGFTKPGPSATTNNKICLCTMKQELDIIEDLGHHISLSTNQSN